MPQSLGWGMALVVPERLPQSLGWGCFWRFPRGGPVALTWVGGSGDSHWGLCSLKVGVGGDSCVASKVGPPPPSTCRLPLLGPPPVCFYQPRLPLLGPILFFIFPGCSCCGSSWLLLWLLWLLGSELRLCLQGLLEVLEQGKLCVKNNKNHKPKKGLQG